MGAEERTLEDRATKNRIRPREPLNFQLSCPQNKKKKKTTNLGSLWTICGGVCILGSICLLGFSGTFIFPWLPLWEKAHEGFGWLLGGDRMSPFPCWNHFPHLFPFLKAYRIRFDVFRHLVVEPGAGFLPQLEISLFFEGNIIKIGVTGQFVDDDKRSEFTIQYTIGTGRIRRRRQ